MIFRRRTLGLLAAAGASALASCSTTTTTAIYPPITGIEITSSTLVAGYGCGKGATQVFRYAAAVSFQTAIGEAGAPVLQSGVPLTNIFDCFADGVFENLPSSDGGGLTFTVKVFAYNKDSYDDAGLPADPGCPPEQDSGSCTPTSHPLTAAQEIEAPWITKCTATQQAGTPVLAVCDPLYGQASRASGDASTDAAPDGPTDAASGPASDAATDGPAAAAPDGATDAAPDAAPDGAAASPDAGDASTDAPSNGG